MSWYIVSLEITHMIVSSNSNIWFASTTSVQTNLDNRFMSLALQAVSFKIETTDRSCTWSAPEIIQRLELHWKNLVISRCKAAMSRCHHSPINQVSACCSCLDPSTNHTGSDLSPSRGSRLRAAQLCFTLHKRVEVKKLQAIVSSTLLHFSYLVTSAHRTRASLVSTRQRSIVARSSIDL